MWFVSFFFLLQILVQYPIPTQSGLIPTQSGYGMRRESWKKRYLSLPRVDCPWRFCRRCKGKTVLSVYISCSALYHVIQYIVTLLSVYMKYSIKKKICILDMEQGSRGYRLEITGRTVRVVYIYLYTFLGGATQSFSESFYYSWKLLDWQ